MRMMSKTAGWLVFLLLAVYYIVNRYPGLGFIDSGELALSALVYGIPHPTGYPLYITLAHFSTFFFARPITAVILLSTVITAGAGALFFCLLRLITIRLFPNLRDRLIAPVLGGLILFLAPVIAEQGMTNEVYGLALFLNLAVLYAALKTITEETGPGLTRWLILSWYLAGLSLCNHMTSVQFLPGLLYISFMALRRRFDGRKILAAALAFAVPLTFYLVLPIRAASQPIANWGDVTTWNNFYRHVSGWQFKVWMFSGNLSVLWSNLKNFVTIIYGQYPPVLLPLAVFGFYQVFRLNKKIGVLQLLTVALNVFMGVNYSIPDIDSYFMTTIVIVCIAAICGLYWLSRYFRIWYIPATVVGALLIWQVVAVKTENYYRDYTLPEDYALNIGRSARPGAIVLSEMWDHQAQLYYLQQAEHFRPDVRFIDKELLRRSWYFKTIKRLYPDLYPQIADLAEPFLVELAKFEKGGPYDSGRLEYYYQGIINRLLTRCGPAYIDFHLSYTAQGNQYLQRQGVLYAVDTTAATLPLAQPQLVWRGRLLSDYTDWRAKHHVDMIRQMTR